MSGKKVWFCANCGYEVTSRGRCYRCRERLVASPLPELPVMDDDDEVGYRLEEWDEAGRARLIVALIRANVTHRFDDEELVVAAADEERVDDLLEDVAATLAAEAAEAGQAGEAAEAGMADVAGQAGEAGVAGQAGGAPPAGEGNQAAATPAGEAGAEGAGVGVAPAGEAGAEGADVGVAAAALPGETAATGADSAGGPSPDREAAGGQAPGGEAARRGLVFDPGDTPAPESEVARLRLLYGAARRLERDPTDMQADGDVAEASATVFSVDHFP